MKSSRRKLTAFGVSSGIGSMLISARAAGFEVLGNVESRPEFWAEDSEGRNTYRENFPDTIFVKTLDEIGLEEPDNRPPIDLVMGHPSCGNFTTLNKNKSYQKDPESLVGFISGVKLIRPRFFIMDNLPKSLGAYTMEDYVRELPEYDLFPEWVGNFYYGNVQMRKRFFLIGALKSEKFVFVPNEEEHDGTVEKVIGDLMGKEGKYPNHEKHVLDVYTKNGFHLRHRGHQPNWRELCDFMLTQRPGTAIPYHGPDGSIMRRIGASRGYWDRSSRVVTGSINPVFHNRRGTPYTIRERARLQGFPDDFIFYGLRLNKKGEWNHEQNPKILRQTGRAIPTQFTTYVAKQIALHRPSSTLWKDHMAKRLLKPEPYISAAKTTYCERSGYANQKGACKACWLKSSCTLPRRVV